MQPRPLALFLAGISIAFAGCVEPPAEQATEVALEKAFDPLEPQRLAEAVVAEAGKMAVPSPSSSAR